MSVIELPARHLADCRTEEVSQTSCWGAWLLESDLRGHLPLLMRLTVWGLMSGETRSRSARATAHRNLLRVKVDVLWSAHAVRLPVDLHSGPDGSWILHMLGWKEVGF